MKDKEYIHSDFIDTLEIKSRKVCNVELAIIYDMDKINKVEE